MRLILKILKWIEWKLRELTFKSHFRSYNKQSKNLQRVTKWSKNLRKVRIGSGNGCLRGFQVKIRIQR